MKAKPISKKRHVQKPGHWRKLENRQQFLIDLSTKLGFDPMVAENWRNQRHNILANGVSGENMPCIHKSNILCRVEVFWASTTDLLRRCWIIHSQNCNSRKEVNQYVWQRFALTRVLCRITAILEERDSTLGKRRKSQKLPFEFRSNTGIRSNRQSQLAQQNSDDSSTPGSISYLAPITHSHLYPKIGRKSNLEIWRLFQSGTWGHIPGILSQDYK